MEFKLQIVFVMLALLSSLGKAESHSADTDIRQSLALKGFYEYLNDTIAEEDFSSLYQSVDEFWELGAVNADFRKSVLHILENYNNFTQSSSNPVKLNIVSYVSNDKFFQSLYFTSNFISYVTTHHQAILYDYPQYSRLIEKMAKLLPLVHDSFLKQLTILASSESSVTEKVLDINGKLCLQVALIKTNTAQVAHVDSTYFSLLLHNNDPLDAQNLQVATPRDGLHLSDYHVLPRKFGAQSIFLITGQHVDEFSAKFHGLPHIVLAPPSVRYSIAVFANRPNRYPVQTQVLDPK